MGIAYTSVLGRHGIDGITHITQFIAKGFQNGGYDFSDWRTNGVGGHDFNGDASVPLVFLVYLVQKFPENPGSTTSVTRSRAYKIPGYGELRRTFYHLTISQQQSGSNPLRNHILIHKEGPGEFYDEIHIVRIEFENTTGKIHSLHAGSVPSDTGTLSVLDSMALSDYNALTKYLGFRIKPMVPENANLRRSTMDYSHVVLLFTFFVLCCMCTVRGQEAGFAATFSGYLNGIPATLVIGQKEDRLTGTLDAAGYKYILEGTTVGSNSDGVITDPQTGSTMTYNAKLESDTLTLTIDNPAGPIEIPFQCGAQNDITNQTPGDDVDRDSNIIGVWATQVIMNTPAGSVATELLMEIRADGTLMDLGSRVIGSFPNAGLDTGFEAGVETAAWRTQQN